MSNIVLTPNRRLAATLQKSNNNQYVAKNISTWPTADILPLNTWLQRSWDQYANSCDTDFLVLTSTQEKLIWEKIIRRTNHYDHLLRISDTAEKAYSAYQLLKQWCVDLHHPLFEHTEDYKALQSWALEFEAICKASRWLPQASLADVIADKIDLSTSIQLYGFTDISPQIKKLFERFHILPETIYFQTSDTQQARRIGLKDSDTELLNMAKWAKAIHNRHPEARIGCVIPKLDRIRDRVVLVFKEVLGETTLFNISAGKSLAHYPVIKTALQLLAINNKPLPHQLFREILTSPFIGEAEQEKFQRYALDVKLRQENAYSVSIQSSLLKRCPRFLKRIQQFMTVLDGEKRSYHDWSLHFTEMLLALGWPGERSLNSEEYQTIDAWMSLLNEFSTMDYIDQPVHLHEALSTLRRMASNKQFQAESPEANIQLLGLLEAASLPFDHLWLMDMSDLNWPQQPNPNPFIPKQLQRELKMPHSTSERELRFSAVMTQQFKESAKEVIFSYPECEDEVTLQPSPLIRELSLLTEADLNLDAFESIIDKIHASQSLESIEDDKGPDLTHYKVPGGVDVLKQQALCPFKAFALYRLDARELESPLPGLKAKTRGRIIHQVLEQVWKSLKNHETLISYAQSDLNDVVKCAIEFVFANQSLPTSRPEYIKLEKARLFRLVSEWLEIEKTREAFEVISQEEKKTLQIERLEFSVRIDRIDQIGPQQKLILDYKTGKHNFTSSWLDDRPDEPQLPLYTLLDPTNTAGIAFAQVASEELCFKGLSQLELGIDGIKVTPQWQEQLQTWKFNLEELSREFASGCAIVNPKEADKTCKYCELETLCRINEHA